MSKQIEILKTKFAECDRLQQQLWTYRPLSEDSLRSLREYYRIGLTYTSNAIEGNSLTESETKVVIEDGLTIEGKPLRDVYEAIGHAKAYDFIHELSTEKPITESDILQTHKLFYQQIDPQEAGTYRNVPVFISGSNYPVTSVKDIPYQMARLLEWYNSHENKLHPVELAAQLHKRFVFIHPFIDGNGRMARLLMNLALLRNEYNIAIIPAVTRVGYITTLEQAHKDDTPFLEFILDRVINTQEDILRLFKETIPTPETIPFKQLLLKAIATSPGLNAPTLSMRVGRSLRTTQRYLKVLSSEKKIEFRGAPKNGGYYTKA